MISKEQAVKLGEDGGEIHCGTCKATVGARGGVLPHVEKWRPNGRCQTWKTRPNEFRLPIKYGMYGYGEIAHTSASQFHLASECDVYLGHAFVIGATGEAIFACEINCANNFREDRAHGLIYGPCKIEGEFVSPGRFSLECRRCIYCGKVWPVGE